MALTMSGKKGAQSGSKDGTAKKVDPTDKYSCPNFDTKLPAGHIKSDQFAYRFDEDTGHPFEPKKVQNVSSKKPKMEYE